MTKMTRRHSQSGEVRLSRRLLMATTLAASLATWAAPAAAQQGTIEEIIVTAQRREENLQSVPVTVTAIGAQAVAAAGVSGTAGISALASGIVITQTIGAPNTYIRGVGASGSATGEEGSNAWYIDGVYLGALAPSVFQFNNIERIEVLKGPQGTLYGRNATGGLIHIITRNPTYDPALELTGTYGNKETVKAGAYMSGGLTDTLAANLALNYADQNEGFGRNLLTGRDIYKFDSWGARGKLMWEPSDDTRVLLSADYAAENSSMAAPRTILPGSFDSAGDGYAGGHFLVRNNVNPFTYMRGGGGSLRVDHDMGWAQLVSLSAQRIANTGQRYDQDGSRLNSATVDYRQTDRQTSQELQLQAPGDSKIQWIVGAFYMRLTAIQRPLELGGTTQAANGGFDRRYGRLHTISQAVFAQATAPVGMDTRLTVGGRYTKDRRHFTGRDDLGTGARINVQNKRQTWDKITYRVAVDHDFGEDIMGYVSYARGFKSGMFVLTNLTNPPVQPETLDAFEAGIKSEFFDNRLRANVSAWHYSYKDIQLSQRQAGSTFVFNASSAKIRGIDADFVAAPMQHLTLKANINVMRGRYGDFAGAPASLPNPVNPAAVPAGYVCTAPFPTTVGGNKTCTLVNGKGNTTVKSPKVSYTLSARYAIPTDSGEFSASGSYYFNDGYFYEVDNRAREPSYSLLSGQLAWTSVNERYGVTLWGANLTNEKYNVNISTSTGDTYTPAPGRTFGVTFDVKL